MVIESDTIQFIGCGCQVLLLPLEDSYILGNRRFAILKAPTENTNLF